LTIAASGGAAAVTVTTGATCAWTASSDRGWMTIGSGASGTGPGTVSVSLTANAGSAARTGTLTVGGQAVGVTQSGAEPCTIAVAPPSASYSKDAATGTFAVTAPAACGWTAASSDGWITITSGASATGNGTVGYAITRNMAAAARTGTIRVESATFSIAQAGDPPPEPPVCEFQVSPVTLNACMAAPYDLLVNVATAPSCAWTVGSDTPWITTSGGVSRSGPGEIRFRIGDNYDAPRVGVVKVRWDTPTAGQNVQVAQAGCTYAVNPASRAVPADGGPFTFDVFQQSNPIECGGPLQDRCVWSASADVSWITITTSMPQAGDGRVSFTVASNAGAARTGRISVRGKVVTVDQAAR
jgi:hypothetical protein